MKSIASLTITLIAATALNVSDAFAKPDHHKHAGKRGGDHKHSDSIDIRISVSDRVYIRDYLHDNYRPHCPPGLAKKHNGCLPPGIAKKYAVGQPLVVGYQPIPMGLRGHLHPPRGYQYVMVDRDVLLISEATHHIVDAITLLSAVQ